MSDNVIRGPTIEGVIRKRRERAITGRGYLALLGVIYISIHFYAEKVLRETQKIEKELHEMRAESITRASDLMTKSKQSEVLNLVKQYNLGLEEAVTPPQQIIVDR